MQNKREILMILVAVIGITLLYKMVLSVPTSKCGQEGFAGQTEKPTTPGCYLYTNDCASVPAGPNPDGPFLDANNWFPLPGAENSQIDTEEKCKSLTITPQFNRGMQRAGCTVSDNNYLFIPQNSSATPTTETTTPDSGLDNYNFFSKNSIPTVYYGPDNSTARVTVSEGEVDVNGVDTRTYSITVTSANGATKTYVMETSPENTIVNPLTNIPETTTTTTPSSPVVVPDSIANTRFVDQEGNIAKLYVATNGQYVVQTRQINGYDMVYTSTNVFTYDRNNAKSFLVGDTVNDITPIGEAQSTTNSLINSLTNNTLSSQQAQTINGIPGRMIPVGQEDLYILKSQVVPPVCPRCPTICAGNNTKNTCPPCPSCARCPESTDFTCQKVPDYSTNTSGSISGGDSMWGPGSSSSISSSNGANGAFGANGPIGANGASNGSIGANGATNGITSSYNNQYDQYRNNSKFSPVPVVSSFSTFGM